jgi:hypothetical protein
MLGVTGTPADAGDSSTVLLVESAMPTYDALIVEHLVVHADRVSTFRAVRALDFLTVRTPLLTAAMWVRGLPARWSAKPIPPLPRLVLAEGVGLPGWLVLGEQPDYEFAFGAVGKFWQPNIEWRDVPAADFISFGEPGWGKIAADFTVLPYGEHATLLSYECRTATTDPEARRRFLRYWWLVRPFVAHIMRATLHTIRANAESAPRVETTGSESE